MYIAICKHYIKLQISIFTSYLQFEDFMVILDVRKEIGMMNYEMAYGDPIGDPWGIKTKIKNKTTINLFYEFGNAVFRRLGNDNLNMTKNYKLFPDAKHNFNQRSFNDGNYQFSKLHFWLEEQVNNNVLHESLTTKELLTYPYISVIENYIDQYVIKYCKKLKVKEVQPVIEPIKVEVNHENLKRSAGRPKGSKNKKPEKELFMPQHIIPTINGKIDMSCVIKAIADLVWRNPGKMDSYYLDFLKLNDLQKKYVNYCFIKNREVFENKYWKIEFKGKTKILVPKTKRAGYYAKEPHGEYDLFSLTYLSNKSGIGKMTLIYRLKHMRIKDAMKKA